MRALCTSSLRAFPLCFYLHLISARLLVEKTAGKIPKPITKKQRCSSLFFRVLSHRKALDKQQFTNDATIELNSNPHFQ